MWSVLAADSWLGHDAVKVLIDAKADIDAKDEDGRTSLHMAAMKDRAAAAEVLVSSKATVDVSDNQGKTALHFAAKNECNATLHALLASPADLRIGGTKKKSRRRHRRGVLPVDRGDDGASR